MGQPLPALISASPIDAPLDLRWRRWVLTFCAEAFRDVGGAIIPMAPYHAALWSWVWSLRRGHRPRPFVAIWPRGAGKSTTAEWACVAVGARWSRRYALYVCETQDQADTHVQNIATRLESPRLAQAYPALASRRIGKYGQSKGWRRNRLRTASGLTVDAMGLDSAARGAKIEDVRPDLMIFDDLDGLHDSPAVTAKKIETLTQSLLPAGSDDVAVLAIQNLVHPNSLFVRLVDGRAEFLADRQISGPFPAVQGLTYEQRDGRYVVMGGQPTWAGMDLDACQRKLDTVGLTAFLRECQHEVEQLSGGLFDHLVYRHCPWDAIPTFERIGVWVDPAVTDTDESDCHGIQADGIAPDGTIYRLFSWEDRTSPRNAMLRAVLKAIELGAETVGVETNQGGDLWQETFEAICEELKVTLHFESDKGDSGTGSKIHRASEMLAEYEQGRIVHVEGTHVILERALNRFPKQKPFDLVDAAYWSWHDLRTREKFFWI